MIEYRSRGCLAYRGNLGELESENLGKILRHRPTTSIRELPLHRGESLKGFKDPGMSKELFLRNCLSFPGAVIKHCGYTEDTLLQWIYHFREGTAVNLRDEDITRDS